MSTTEEQRFEEELEALHNIIFDQYFEENQTAQDKEVQSVVQNAQIRRWVLRKSIFPCWREK